MDKFKSRVVTIQVNVPLFFRYNVQLNKPSVFFFFSFFWANLGHGSNRVETLIMLTLQVPYIISLIVS